MITGVDILTCFSLTFYYIALKMSSKCVHKMFNKDRIIQIVMVFREFTIVNLLIRLYLHPYKRIKCYIYSASVFIGLYLLVEK
jgi:hypothetical protein